ncbi:MAG: S9 family peptidase [Xanthomonadales bacterium]|nr:S9 family peptidase [Xanthomonadales bacterium]
MGMVLSVTSFAEVTPPSVPDFLKNEPFTRIKISPTGKYLAAIAPMESGSALFILERETMQRSGYFYAGERIHVVDFAWVSDDQVMFAVGEQFVGYDAPSLTGELYITRADGTGQELLIGFRANDGQELGSKVNQRKRELVFASMIDNVASDDHRVLVAISPIKNSSMDSYTTAERMDIRSGRRVVEARAPVRRAQFGTDPQGRVRFAQGAGGDNMLKLYYREVDSEDWILINDQAATDHVVSFMGFAPDGVTAYLRASRDTGPDVVESFDTETHSRTAVMQHDRVSPTAPIASIDGHSVIGTWFMDPQPTARYFDDQHPDARLLRSLQASFGDAMPVSISSATRDGRFALLFASSPTNPGDYFLFDREAKKAQLIGSRREWIQPDQLADMHAVEITTRDGLKLQGLLTVPIGREAKDLPVVVNPHGGPFDVRDDWGYNTGVQILASRGYAVLQVNFRGSSGYGKDFERAGYRQWGRAMQDDLTDATRWLIDQGIANAKRICIAGGSYGGYAALMGVAKEPDLFRCAIGYIGVYDLAMMYSNGDIPQLYSGKNYLTMALGKDGLAETSPVNLADRIKVPVLLAAGGADERAPVEHTEAMERALKAAGVPVDTLIYRDEGHGFFKYEHRLEYYTKVLDFLDKHIGQSAK